MRLGRYRRRCMDELTRELKPGLSREDLRSLTAARIALGRTGDAVRTEDELAFQLDHAAARDAVHAQLNPGPLVNGLRERGWPSLLLQSAACVDGWERSRRAYLQRPDLGRRLSSGAAEQLKASVATASVAAGGVSVVLADGLSATAVERHALPLLDALLARMPAGGLRATPVCVVQNGRVAIGDEVGSLLGAEVSVVLIGERPGLSSPDSMGVYVTWQPRVGRTDAERNCISNIRGGGLSYEDAAGRLHAQLVRAREIGMTGVSVSGHRLLEP